ncbi:MAG: hypothetical protein OSA87_00855 [Woeseiaceae bacterium]|jgi:ribosomal protein S18 acetylase RimI-like enzyme|nr:hypothetical protein [Woeseiaceae bacterium]
MHANIPALFLYDRTKFEDREIHRDNEVTDQNTKDCYDYRLKQD